MKTKVELSINSSKELSVLILSLLAELETLTESEIEYCLIKEEE